MTNKAVTSQSQSVASGPFTPVARSSRRARNDERWDSLKEEIFEIYILKDSTLQDTKQLTEDKHGFVARCIPLQDTSRWIIKPNM